MSIELKPCPFCGGEARSVHTTWSNGGWYVCCPACETINGLLDGYGFAGKYGTEAEAAEAWNHRAERTCRAIPHDNLNESEGMGDAWEVCSECGALLAVITDNRTTPNYCPNCGAKVVE